MRFSRSSEMLRHITRQLTTGVSEQPVLPIKCHAVKGPNFSWTPLLPKMKPKRQWPLTKRMPRNVYNIPEDFRFQQHSGRKLKSSVSYLELY